MKDQNKDSQIIQQLLENLRILQAQIVVQEEAKNDLRSVIAELEKKVAEPQAR